jgi:hypothetical protein
MQRINVLRVKKSQAKYLKYVMKDNVNYLFFIDFMNRCSMPAISCTLHFELQRLPQNVKVSWIRRRNEEIALYLP